MQLFRNKFIPVLITLLLAACGGEKKYTPFIFSTEIGAEGPLFEGANTLQGTLSSALKNFLNAKGLKPEEVAAAVLVSSEVSTEDSSGLDNIQALTLHFASDNSDMIKLAAINPVPAGKTATLNVAGEQEKLKEILMQDQVYLVADAILKQDSPDSLKLKCNFTFQLEMK